MRPAALLIVAGVLLTGAALPLRQTKPRPSAPQAPSVSPRERAYRANNVGVAHLEQYNYDEAARSFREALRIDSALAIARLNLAIALLYAGNADEAATAAEAVAGPLAQVPQASYAAGLIARAQGRVDDAIAAFQRVLKLDSSDAGSRINLGQVYIQQRNYKDAVAVFREALAAEPFNATAAYGLATALTRAGAGDEGTTAMRQFETLRDAPYAVTYSQTYLEQGRYGEAIASTGAEPDLVDTKVPAVKFADATTTMLPASARNRPAAVDARDLKDVGSITLADIDNDGDLDLFAIDAWGQRLYVNAGRGPRLFSDQTRERGLVSDDSGGGFAAVIGDYDNDDRADLLLLTPGGPQLRHQRADGHFEDASAAAGIGKDAPGPSAALVDVDHDGDLDIFIVGAGKPNRLLRNNGNGTFTEVADAAGTADGTSAGIAVAPTDFDNRRDIDMMVLPSTGSPRLFKNMRDGSFRDVAGDVGLNRPGAYTAMAAADVNKDGFTDFLLARADGPALLMLSDGHGKFTAGSAPDGTAGATVAQFVDYDNDGLLDLFTANGSTAKLFRNLGGTWSDVSDAAGLTALSSSLGGLTGSIRSVAFGDVDRDGDLDAAVLLTSGQLRLWRNDGGSAHRSVLVRVTGRVSNHGGVGSKVELRAGSLRQRFETSAATPALAPADVLFGLGSRAAADVVRIIWPSGTLQAETTTATARTVTITELDRKPSSCPFLYTWNGRQFEFVTDFMGGGEIGYWEGPGSWNQPDPDEYVRIPPGKLVPRGNRYELRVTNELEEALFVDRLQLVAVDHAKGVDVFPKEGLGAPAEGPFTLVTTQGARPVEAAHDEHGHDVLPQLRAIDRRYPDDFALLEIRGYAAPHELRLDLGAAFASASVSASANAVLLATGWTDYAFSSDNLAAYQRGLHMASPSLEARTADGSWRQVIADIGIPVGRPQTVVVDLRGKLAPGEHEVRILTNMRIYWDQILVDTSGGDQARIAHITRLDPSVADLHWRGFSRPVTPDGREPFGYDYATVTHDMPWKTMVGRYTREGDVRELLTREDDMFVVARSGDEISLSFDAASLPPLANGMARTFLLYAYGFSKEMDITSATPDTLEPLPFGSMRRYPYGADERYPSTAAHREYREKYNTRVVARPLPPLESGSGPRAHSDGSRLKAQDSSKMP